MTSPPPPRNGGMANDGHRSAPSIHGDEYPWAFVDDFTGMDLCAGYVGVPVNAFKAEQVTAWMPFPSAHLQSQASS